MMAGTRKSAIAEVGGDNMSQSTEKGLTEENQPDVSATVPRSKVIHVDVMVAPVSQGRQTLLTSTQNTLVTSGDLGISVGKSCGSDALSSAVSSKNKLPAIFPNPDQSSGSQLAGNGSLSRNLPPRTAAEIDVKPKLPQEAKILTVFSAFSTDQESVPVVIIEEQSESEVKSHSMAQVTNESALPKEILKCEECEYSTYNKHYLKQHTDLVHCEERPFKCPFCDYAGKRSHSLKEHLVVHSSDRPYECHLCNATFRKKGHLTNHIKMHSPQSIVQFVKGEPEGSDLSSSQNDTVSESVHLDSSTGVQITGAAENPENNWVTIKDSDVSISNKAASTGNLPRAPKPPVVLMKCTECGYTSSSKDMLKKHMWIHIDQASADVKYSGLNTTAIGDTVVKPVQNQATNTTFKCGECLHETKEAYKFIAHMLTHKSSPKPDQSSRFVAKKTVHMPKVAGTLSTPIKQIKEETPPCNIQELSGFTHDKTGGRFCCNICGYTCDHQRTIKAHVWKHSGHKDIDYPMFQNGPISIYDESSLSDASAVKIHTPSPNSSEGMQGKDNLVKISPNLSSSQMQSLSKLVPSGPLDNQESKSALQQSANKASKILGHWDSSEKPPLTLLSSAGNSIPSVQSGLPSSSTVEENNSAVKSEDIQHRVPPVRPDTQTMEVNAVADKPKVFVTHSSSGAHQSGKRPLVPDLSQDELTAQTPKRLCKEEALASPNVVVERVNAVSHPSTYTGLRSQQNSPRGGDMVMDVAINEVNMTLCPSVGTDVGSNKECAGMGDASATEIPRNPLVIVAVTDSATVSPAVKGKVWSEEEITRLIESGRIVKSIDGKLLDGDLKVEETTAVSTNTDSSTKTISVQDESALALLSLLQRGPKSNQSPPVEQVPKQEFFHPNEDETPMSDSFVEVREEQVVTVEEGSQTAEDAVRRVISSSVEDIPESNKPKAGICSSLLAVIEQLRERSKSESETDDTSQLLANGKRRPRRRNQRNSRDTPLQVENMENVEKLEDFEVKYRCKLCHYTNSSPPLIKQHMRLHKTKKPFECSLCDFVADSSETLQDHMIQHCKMRTYQCKLCPSAFNYKSQLRAHMRAHSVKDPFLCDTCDFETTNPIAFRNHTRIHVDKSIFKCETCGSFFSNSADLSIHQRDGCKPVGIFACEECMFEASSEDELREHEKVHKKRNLRCAYCDFISPNQSSLRIHTRAHEEAREMKCELCNFIAASSRSLKSHMKRHANDQRYVQQPLEQYKCNLCGYVCHHLPSLKSHMWRHASDKNYVYELTNEVINAAIDYDSRQESTLKVVDDKVESRRDSEEGDESSLLSGMEGNDKRLPCLITFRCCQCGFETISKSDLNQHMKMHSDIIKKTLEVSKTLAQSGLTGKRLHLESMYDSSQPCVVDDCLPA